MNELFSIILGLYITKTDNLRNVNNVRKFKNHNKVL